MPPTSQAQHRWRSTTKPSQAFSLPRGYDTQAVGQGMRPSIGGCQRISLARALRQDALILDEPTGSVNMKTGAAITEAMVRLMHGCITFTIPHRQGVALVNYGARPETEHGRFTDTTLPAVAEEAPVSGGRNVDFRGEHSRCLRA